MNGRKTTYETDKNTPINDFISYLIKQLPETECATEKQKKMRSVMRELKNIEFNLDSKSAPRPQNRVFMRFFECEHALL